MERSWLGERLLTRRVPLQRLREEDLLVPRAVRVARQLPVKRLPDRVLSADLYPCYDSVALATLSFSPGWNHRTDAPYVCKEAKVGKVALLTSRAPGEPEAERFIFAILLIARVRVAGADHSAPGTEFYEGDKSASIVLERSTYVPFWDHYRNPRAPNVTAWNTGLFRYVDDATVREILTAVSNQLSLSRDQRRKAEALLERY